MQCRLYEVMSISAKYSPKNFALYRNKGVFVKKNQLINYMPNYESGFFVSFGNRREIEKTPVKGHGGDKHKHKYIYKNTSFTIEN
jgi:hypothetical protein